MREKAIEKIENEFDILHGQLVPISGVSETVEGEMLRAIGRIIYRYHNDGDYYFRGYGIETAGESSEFLMYNTPISEKLLGYLRAARILSYEHDDEREYTDSDKYQHNLFLAAKEIIKYVKSKDGKYEKNTCDSR